jgi:hypothetical protein
MKWMINYEEWKFYQDWLEGHPLTLRVMTKEKTPKQKAEELVDKFDNEVFDDNDWYMSKQCAVICCDEVINSMTVATSVHLPYWKEVKRIIQEEL